MIEITRKQYRKFTYVISYDEDCPSPREDDNLCTIYYAKSKEFNINEILDDSDGLLDEFIKCNYWRFIYKTDHGCVSLSPYRDDNFDISFFGVIAIDKNKVDEKMLSSNNIYVRMDYEIKRLQQWMNGEVYTYQIFDEVGNEVDTLGGIYDDIDELEKNLQHDIDYHILRRDDERKRIAHYLSVCWQQINGLKVIYNSSLYVVNNNIIDVCDICEGIIDDGFTMHKTFYELDYQVLLLIYNHIKK